MTRFPTISNLLQSGQLRDITDRVPTTSLAPPTAKARRSDPSSARRAAVLAFPRQQNQRRRLLEAVRTLGGATYEEAANATGIAGVSASTRLTELLDGGWLQRTADTRPTSNGGDASVLVLTAEAVRQLEAA